LKNNQLSRITQLELRYESGPTPRCHVWLQTVSPFICSMRNILPKLNSI